MDSILTMSGFKRSPSKVWWGSESLEFREVSSSPGSQDSGFSDTETSPKTQTDNKNAQETPKRSTIPKDIYKELSSEQTNQNLSANYKEKNTPEKPKINTDRLVKTEVKITPKRPVELSPNTEPQRKQRYTKNSPKVSRNLFNAKQKECKSHQYSTEAFETSRTLNTSEEATVDDSYSWRSDKTRESFQDYSTQSEPLFRRSQGSAPERNRSAPGDLERFKDHEAVTSFNSSLSSDCESELECIFNGHLESPKHTSTPKAGVGDRMCHRREKLPLNLFLKYQNERVPPIHPCDTDNKAVQNWLEDTRKIYEQECMMTLQCKSIAGELQTKVSHLAAVLTTCVRGIISHSRCIEMEYENLNGEIKHIDPLIQSLTGNIIDFLKTYTRNISSKILKLCDEIRISKSKDSLKLIPVLIALWNDIRQDLMCKELSELLKKLECPTSELELRATITGITSIALRNEEVVDRCIQADIIPILLILCEKCEGSSLRSLILRALSTMCCNSLAIRQFEKFSGVQIIADTLEEDSRPEPERSEAVALLAQVTAPWLEDNHSIKGLQDYSRKLVKALTKFSAGTSCCQNLLLCAAALANLSSMDTKAMKYMIHINTAAILLEAAQSRGPRASIYLFEQIAILIANMSSSEAARKELTDIKAPVALLSFLKITNYAGEDVEKRLQQKSIIALSRLCGNKEAAMQIVEQGGMDKLVRMCRERTERHDSDAILVAALATLRKIVDSCGSEVLSAQDVQELVEPKLLDSFLAYSTQNESYV